MTNFIAIITTVQGRLASGSTITIGDEDGNIVATADVPDHVEYAGVLLVRICAAIRSLGFQPVGGDFYGALRYRGDTVEVNVEPLP
jgi:hypothetical protein